MGIRDKRFFTAVNRIIREELQKGNLPSSREFSARLSHYMKSFNISRPEFQYYPIRPGTLARSSDYNRTMIEVNNDLSILYENTIDLHNDLAKNFSQFEVDKERLDYELNLLENKLKEMILLYTNSGFIKTVYDVFDDLEKVNAEETTAHIDVKNHEVGIAEIKNTSFRIYPESTASFSLLPAVSKDVKTTKINGTPSSALSDNIDETWQQLITSPQKEEIAGYYFVNFKTKQMMNRIDLSIHGVVPTNVKIEFTPDNINWFSLPYHEESKKIIEGSVYDFPSIEIQRLRILLSKIEPDDQSANNDFAKEEDEDNLYYKYLIGIKSLKMFQLDFPSEATLVSKPLKPDLKEGENFSINKVSLIVDEVLPNGTDIKYWIGVPETEAGRDIEWRAISPSNRETPEYDQIIDFKNITRAPAYHFEIESDISVGEYELESYYTNGIKFYKIGEVEESKKIIEGTERLFVGKESFGIKYFTGEFDDHSTHTPSIADWDEPLSNVQHSFHKIEDGKPGLILDKEKHKLATSYMFTTGVFSEKKEELVSAVPASTEPIAIYMNGELLYQGIPNSSDKINYLFKGGWNEIVILLYTRNPLAANGVTLDLSFDVREYGANVYSSPKPLEQVTLFDLRYNIKSNDRNKYALTEVNDKTYIVLNHIVQGLDYDFFFHFVDGDAKQEILLKAEFLKTRELTNVSPKIKSYRLGFS
ncbi:structural protein [Bacillus phage vB_BauM_KLEB27-3]|nr:structural protein [Bacillus phage vB_BauM_KLEB27-3]